ncbi:MAG: hypothetical protein ABI304_08540 [Rudaea sp.]
MDISLTELRQRLFQLADQVIETGEPLVVMRRGVRLQLVRDDAGAQTSGRLARLKPQRAVVGAALSPYESPAQWNPDRVGKVAEPAPARKLRKTASPRGKRTPRVRTK